MSFAVFQRFRVGLVVLPAVLSISSCMMQQATFTPAEVEEAVVYMRAMARLTEPINTVLRGVHDQATADAAAPILRARLTEFYILGLKAENLNRPSRAFSQAIRESLHEPDFGEEYKELQEHLARMADAGCYGSDLLTTALIEAKYTALRSQQP